MGGSYADEAAFTCSGCGAEYRAGYVDVRCIDCGGQLRDEHGQLVEQPPEFPVEGLPDDDGFDDEFERDVVLQPFPTDNPYLRRVFAHPAFGAVPAKAMDHFLVVSPDEEEDLVAAVRTRHGKWSHGYLLLTTQWLRWIQTLPTRADDLWSLDYDLVFEGLGMEGVLRTASGDQFQLSRGRAKRFAELHRLLQLAYVWENDHAQAQPTTAPQEPAAPAATASLADELAKLGALHQQGLLDAAEFAQAKARLLGTG